MIPTPAPKVAPLTCAASIVKLSAAQVAHQLWIRMGNK
jgi:hypothetical protein